jgi:hypothetical protein
MEFFGSVRLFIGNVLLSRKRERIKRKVIFSNISNVKNIGVVWDASRAEDITCLTRFHQKMHERHINVKIIGFYPGNNLPDQYTAIRYLSCLKKNEINLLYRPVSSDAEAFIDKHFDVLIDINFKKLFPLRYISSMSLAGLKVGLRDGESNNTPFDLMMELKKPVDIENYLNQILIYLEMINSESDIKLTKKH